MCSTASSWRVCLCFGAKTQIYIKFIVAVDAATTNHSDKTAGRDGCNICCLWCFNVIYCWLKGTEDLVSSLFLTIFSKTSIITFDHDANEGARIRVMSSRQDRCLEETNLHKIQLLCCFWNFQPLSSPGSCSAEVCRNVYVCISKIRDKYSLTSEEELLLKDFQIFHLSEKQTVLSRKLPLKIMHSPVFPTHVWSIK